MHNFETVLTTLVISVMSFFGWTTKEYEQVLPHTLNEISKDLETAFEKVQKIEQNQNKLEEKKKEKSEAGLVKPTKPIEETSKPSKVIKDKTTENNTEQVERPVNKKPAPTVTTNPSSQITPEQKVKSALGNVYCSTIEGNRVQKITGSAVAISNNGVMITNAHVAEHILLSNTKAKNSNCFVRTGSPARKAYSARVVFLPEEWVLRNKDNLKFTSVTGTGEHDYALILLDEKINTSADQLTFIEPVSNSLEKRASVILGGYPAFNANVIENALYPVIDTSRIVQTFALGNETGALGDTSPSILAIHGSSGGAVGNENGDLIGIIVASILDSETQKPSIRFISFDYIKDDIKEKTGNKFEQFIQNADNEASNFIKGKGAELAHILISNSK